MQDIVKNAGEKSVAALVTGASSGLGLEFARQLAEKNYQLVLVSNQEKEINEAALSLAKTYGVKTWPLYMDLSEHTAAESLFNFCQENQLKVEVVVNNAGIFTMDRIINLSPTLVEKTLNLHMVTATLICRYFGEAMKKRGRGYILNNSSISAWLPYPALTLYSATKKYIKHFSVAFAQEMRDYGVFVTVICPGAIDTNLYSISTKLRSTVKKLGLMYSPAQIAKKSLRCLFKGKQLVFFGFITQFLLVLLKLIPLRVITWAMKKFHMLKE